MRHQRQQNSAFGHAKPSMLQRAARCLSTIRWVVCVIFFTLFFGEARNSLAFKVDSGFGRGIWRWNAAPYEIGGFERSLDGGLRYSIQGGSYEAFRDRFQWEGAPPSVEELQAAVENAFAAWQVVDPETGFGTNIRFVPDFETEVDFGPVPADPVDWFRFNPGAEIDIVVTTVPPGFNAIGAFYASPVGSTVTLTSGVDNYHGAAISGADIMLNVNKAWTVTGLQGTLTHEIGHALGLDDVDIPSTLGNGGVTSLFYDDNFDGSSSRSARETLTNSFAALIDPFDPDNSPALMQYDVCTPGGPLNCSSNPGLQTSGVHILMESSDRRRRDHTLQNDDFAGRQFLYPFVRVPGDYDGDQTLTSNDIDLLSLEIEKDEPRYWFDVTDDGNINQTDRTKWIRDLQNTWFGDSNLDGEFNSGDLTLVFQAGQYEDDMAQNSTWSTGDWNGDREFDSGDLVMAFQDGGYEQGPLPAEVAVPEPTSLPLFVGIIMVLARRASRRFAN